MFHRVRKIASTPRCVYFAMISHANCVCTWNHPTCLLARCSLLDAHCARGIYATCYWGETTRKLLSWGPTLIVTTVLALGRSLCAHTSRTDADAEVMLSSLRVTLNEIRTLIAVCVLIARTAMAPLGMGLAQI